MKILLLVNDGIERMYQNNELKGCSGLVLLSLSKKGQCYLLSKDRFANEILYPIIIDRFNGKLDDAISVLLDRRDEFKEFLQNILNKGESIAFVGIRREFENAFSGNRVTHDFNRIELARKAAKALIPEGVKVNLRNPDIKIKVLAYGKLIIVAWSILENLWKKRLYRKNIHKAALKPTVAAFLVSLGSLNIYDPMCGYGTIPFEALAFKHEIPILTDLSERDMTILEEKLDLSFEIKIKEKALGFIYCSDASEEGIKKAIENLEFWKESLEKKFGLSADFSIEFDVRDVLFHEPFHAERIVVNPPYGMRSTRLKALPMIYRALAEFAYRSGAKCFDVITHKYELLKDVSKDLWKLGDEIEVLLNDLYVRVIRFWKSSSGNLYRFSNEPTQ